MWRASSLCRRFRYLFAAREWSKTMSTSIYVSKTISSPVGRLTLVASDAGLAAVLWENDSPRRVPLTIAGEKPGHPVLKETERQLKEYFAGKRTQFELPLD